MSIVQIQPPRFTIIEEPSGLSFVIPMTRNWFYVLFISFWLCGWAFGEIEVGRQLLFGKSGSASLFLIAWLGMWTLGGGFAIYKSQRT